MKTCGMLRCGTSGMPGAGIVGFANGCAMDLQAATSTELRGPLPEAPNTCADSEKRLTDSTVSSGGIATTESGGEAKTVLRPAGGALQPGPW
jgi:hypothetical protein